MKLPESLAAALTAADEAYLIALCNKGTYNRAKKDLAALASPPQAECTPDGVQVQLGQVTCLIRAPLGDSRCSCPSSAVCRHRISAILWLQSQLEGPMDGQAPDREAPPQEAEPDFPSLRAYPPEKLVRQLGARRHAADLVRWQSGQGAKITAGGSVVTVELPWAAASVRLLEPLEHSTCSCHSKSFCVHKAEALFFWQLEQGLVPAALQEAAPAAGSGWDPEQARGVCQGVRQALAAQMATGLSRLPPSVCDTTERLAAPLPHRAPAPAGAGPAPPAGGIRGLLPPVGHLPGYIPLGPLWPGLAAGPGHRGRPGGPHPAAGRHLPGRIPPRWADAAVSAGPAPGDRAEQQRL